MEKVINVSNAISAVAGATVTVGSLIYCAYLMHSINKDLKSSDKKSEE